MKFPGIGDAYATRIIAGRPYAMKSQLETRKIFQRPSTTISRRRSSPVESSRKRVRRKTTSSPVSSLVHGQPHTMSGCASWRASFCFPRGTFDRAGQGAERKPKSGVEAQREMDAVWRREHSASTLHNTALHTPSSGGTARLPQWRLRVQRREGLCLRRLPVALRPAVHGDPSLDSGKGRISLPARP